MAKSDAVEPAGHVTPLIDVSADPTSDRGFDAKLRLIQLQSLDPSQLESRTPAS